MVASPCTQRCTLDAATGWCLGCGRTLSEIAEWGATEPMRQRAILRSLAARLRQLGSVAGRVEPER